MPYLTIFLDLSRSYHCWLSEKFFRKKAYLYFAHLFNRVLGGLAWLGKRNYCIFNKTFITLIKKYLEWSDVLCFSANYCGLDDKESACSAGDLDLIPGLGRSPGEGKGYPLQYSWASLVTQLVKNLPAVWEVWVLSLGWEDPLEEDMAVRSSTVAWRIPWTEEPRGLQPMHARLKQLSIAQHSKFHLFSDLVYMSPCLPISYWWPKF